MQIVISGDIRGYVVQLIHRIIELVNVIHLTTNMHLDKTLMKKFQFIVDRNRHASSFKDSEKHK
jgi:hypothetical protein